MNYWQKRQKQLNEQLEKDEEKLKKRLSSFYDSEYARLEKEIAAYYQKYSTEGVIQYRKLMEELPLEDKRLLMEKMNEFAEKYPQYDYLLPIRESIYKLNRLEGLQYSIRMQQLKIGAVNQEEIRKHLEIQAMRGVNTAAEILGFGKNFYVNNPSITKLFVNVSWCNGKNFSQRIWENTEKLANYLNTDIAQGMTRGDSYARLTRELRKRFMNVSRNDAYRLIYTEGTYVKAESSMQPFEEDFEQYRISTVGDGKVCGICRAAAGKTYDIKDRQSGVNFPPFHSWCRCTFTIEVDDWDAWMDDYEKRHKNGQSETIVGKLRAEQMKISVPDDIYKLDGMTQKIKKEIEYAINKLQEEYRISLTTIEIGDMGKGDIFAAGPYLDDSGKIKFGLVINANAAYNKVTRSMAIRYKNGVFAGKSIEDYIAHEMAHIMTYQDCVTEKEYKTKKKIIEKQFIAGISEYADRTKNGAESLAEAFVRYRNGEKIPISAEILIRSYIERWKK